MSGSKMEPSSRNPGTAASISRRGESSRDWEEVASALLEDGFFLTALELHAELLESGKELSSLRDYFSNPGNFETAFPQPPTALLGNDLGSHACNCCTDTLTTCNECLFQHTLWGWCMTVFSVVLCTVQSELQVCRHLTQSSLDDSQTTVPGIMMTEWQVCRV